MLYSPCKLAMSSVLNFLSGITLSTALHLLGIILLALLVNRLLKILTKLLIKPASGQSRAAQAREQQSRLGGGADHRAGPVRHQPDTSFDARGACQRGSGFRRAKSGA